MELKEVIQKNIDIPYIKKNAIELFGAIFILGFSIFILASLSGTTIHFVELASDLFQIGMQEFELNETATVEHLKFQNSINLITNAILFIIAGVIVFAAFMVLLVISAFSEIVRIITGTRTLDEKLDMILDKLDKNKVSHEKLAAIVSALIAKNIAERVFKSILDKWKKK